MCCVFSLLADVSKFSRTIPSVPSSLSAEWAVGTHESRLDAARKAATRPRHAPPPVPDSAAYWDLRGDGHIMSYVKFLFVQIDVDGISQTRFFYFPRYTLLSSTITRFSLRIKIRCLCAEKYGTIGRATFGVFHRDF